MKNSVVVDIEGGGLRKRGSDLIRRYLPNGKCPIINVTNIPIL